MPESPVNCGHCLFPEPLYIQVIWLFAQPPKIIKSTGLLFSEDNTSSIKSVALEKNSWVSFGRREWKYSPTSTVTVDSPSTKASDSWIHTCFKCGYGVKPLETIFGWWTSKTTNYSIPVPTHAYPACSTTVTRNCFGSWERNPWSTYSLATSKFFQAGIDISYVSHMFPLKTHNITYNSSTWLTTRTISHLQLVTSLTSLPHHLGPYNI